MTEIDKSKVQSELELQFCAQLEHADLTEGVLLQHKVKGHKVDFCWPDLKVIVEIQGGTSGFGKGRGSHVREPGYSKDRTFSNVMQLEGWLVLEFTAPILNRDEAIYIVQRALRQRRNEKGR